MLLLWHNELLVISIPNCNPQSEMLLPYHYVILKMDYISGEITTLPVASLS
jgi:hypothetical protein